MTMTRNDEDLRLAVGLAHAVPGAELHLVCRNGHQLVVGRHPAADLDACSMRRAVMAGHCVAYPDITAWIEVFEVAGSLVECGGGLYRSDCVPGVWWFVTSLGPGQVAEVCHEITVDGVPPDAVIASLRPDPMLGVTVVEVTVDHEGWVPFVEEIARSANARCLVEVLLTDVGAPS